MNCHPGDISCEISRLVAAVEQPTYFEWITLAVGFVGTLAAVFVGIAALRVSAAANRFAAESRKDELERREREVRRKLALDLNAWARNGFSSTEPDGHWAHRQEIKQRADLAGYPEIDGVLTFVTNYARKVKLRQKSIAAKARAWAIALWLIDSASKTWVFDPIAGKKALESMPNILTRDPEQLTAEQQAAKS